MVKMIIAVYVCTVKPFLIFIISFSYLVLTSSGKPNILFILIDDMGWMDLGCQGNENLHTLHSHHQVQALWALIHLEDDNHIRK